MKAIQRAAQLALITVILSPLANANPVSTDQADAPEDRQSVTLESDLVLDTTTLKKQDQKPAECQQTKLDQSSQQLEPTLSSRILESSVESAASCPSSPPPSCTCGSCCHCFACWTSGGRLVFGCN